MSDVTNLKFITRIQQYSQNFQKSAAFVIPVSMILDYIIGGLCFVVAQSGFVSRLTFVLVGCKHASVRKFKVIYNSSLFLNKA
jgi:hypothetical protein